MSKKRDRAVYAFIRKGTSLVPEMEYDARALDGINQGQRVRIEIKEFRNLDRHRAYWAMLHEVVSATECALTPERLHDVIKLEAGLIEHVRLPNGFMVALPGSIAFDKVSEAEFVAFFEAAKRWLAVTFDYAPVDRSEAA